MESEIGDLPISREDIGALLDLIASHEKPAEFARRLADDFARIEASGLTRVTAQHELRWNIEGGSPAATKSFLERFSPNSIEKIAAYAAVLAVILQMASNESENPQVINNIEIRQIEQHLHLHHQEQHGKSNET